MSQTRANQRGKSIFDSILFEGILRGNPLLFTEQKMYQEKAIKWFYEYIRKNIRYANVFQMNQQAMRTMIIPGHLYTWKYDAKYKDTLPYWDMAPMGWILNDEGETFTALNLHYIPPKARILVLRYIYSVMSNTTYDENTKARLNWNRLKRIAMFPFFSQMIHRYRKDHVRSQFVKVSVKHWPIAVFLPTQQFKKATANQVYRDFNRKAGLRTAPKIRKS